MGESMTCANGNGATEGEGPGLGTRSQAHPPTKQRATLRTTDKMPTNQLIVFDFDLSVCRRTRAAAQSVTG